MAARSRLAEGADSRKRPKLQCQSIGFGGSDSVDAFVRHPSYPPPGRPLADDAAMLPVGGLSRRTVCLWFGGVQRFSQSESIELDWWGWRCGIDPIDQTQTKLKTRGARQIAGQQQQRVPRATRVCLNRPVRAQRAGVDRPPLQRGDEIFSRLRGRRRWDSPPRVARPKPTTNKQSAAARRALCVAQKRFWRCGMGRPRQGPRP